MDIIYGKDIDYYYSSADNIDKSNSDFGLSEDEEVIIGQLKVKKLKYNHLLY